MATIANFFWGLGAWNWFLIAALLLILETVVPGVHFVWFGFAAAIVGVLALSMDIAWAWQLIVFGLVACVVVYVMRRYADPSHAQSDLPDLNDRAQQYVGRTVVVEDPITGGRGKVRIGDSLWIVKGADTPSGTTVKVTGVDGTVLIVAPV
jgi:inner membrane protein